jgi:hypothetical protein
MKEKDRLSIDIHIGGLLIVFWFPRHWTWDWWWAYHLGIIELPFMAILWMPK